MVLQNFIFILIGLIDKNMILFKKLKKALKEYEAEFGKDISLHDFFVNYLNYSEEDYEKFISSKGEKKPKKPSGESKRMNKVPYIPEGISVLEGLLSEYSSISFTFIESTIMQNITFKAFIINRGMINFFLEHLLWIAKFGTLLLF